MDDFTVTCGNETRKYLWDSRPPTTSIHPRNPRIFQDLTREVVRRREFAHQQRRSSATSPHSICEHIRMHPSLLSGIWFLSICWCSSSFVPITPFCSLRTLKIHSPSICLRTSRSVNELLHEGQWSLLNDFPTFLNQATIQSLVFLVTSLRDRHTAIWLEDFTQPVIRFRTKDEAYDQVLSNMEAALTSAMHETTAERPIELLTYHGLGAINTTRFPTWNSFFEQLLQEETVSYRVESTRSHVPSYDIEINPASLCSRLVSVREQIAREFAVDLDAIMEMSETMTERYRDGKLEKPNLFFLESSVHEDYTPSPLRKGNFDLLLTLTTQEAVHRILNSDHSAHRKPTVTFLYDFYQQRIETHFTGSNWYGRAEDFLEQLLQTPPATMQIQDDDIALIDPMHVAELILTKREQVAEEWLELALDVGQSHTEIRRWQLNRLLARELDHNPSTGFE